MPSGPTSTGAMLITVGSRRIADIDQRDGIGAFEPDRDKGQPAIVREVQDFRFRAAAVAAVVRIDAHRRRGIVEL